MRRGRRGLTVALVVTGLAGALAQAQAPAPVPSHSLGVGKIDLTAGRKVYEQTCAACHDRGVSGAPRVDRPGDWRARLAQGDEVLFKHTKHGFTGQRGYMPPKGGNPNLSDQDLRNAIAYIKSRVKAPQD